MEDAIFFISIILQKIILEKYSMMDMQKQAIFWLGVATIVVIIFILFLPPNEQNSKNTIETKHYTDFLPQTTVMTIAALHPADLFSKFNKKNHLELLQGIQVQSQMSFGIDITNLEQLEKSGIDAKKACSLAILDKKKGTNVFFIGIQNTNVFWNFLEKSIISRDENTQFTRVTISGVDCLLEGEPEAPNVIHSYQSGYWIIYSTGNLLFRENLLEQFKIDILQEKAKLSQLSIVKKMSGDISIYLDSSLVKELLENFRIQDDPDWAWCKDTIGACLNFDWETKALSLSAYTDVKVDSALLPNYIANSCLEILTKLPEDPICIFSNTNSTQIGDQYFLQSLPFFVFQQNTELANQKNKNIHKNRSDYIAEIFSVLDKNFAEEFDIKSDFQQKLMPYIEGQIIAAAYNIPNNYNLLHTILACKLKDPKSVEQFLVELHNKVLESNLESPPIELAKLELANIGETSTEVLTYSLKLKNYQPIFMVVGSYLFIVSSSDYLAKIILEKNKEILFNHPKCLETLKKGFSSIGYLNLNSIRSQKQSQFFFSKEFQKFFNLFSFKVFWCIKLEDREWSGKIILSSEGDILQQILEIVRK